MTDADDLFSDEEIPDFDEPKSQTIKFRIDGELFEAFASIPAGLFMEHAKVEFPEDLTKVGQDPEKLKQAAEALNRANQRYFRFLDMVLLPESRERFAARLRDVNNPISMKQAGRTYRYLIGKYSGRPTQPPSPSQNGHGGTGDGSTVNVPTGGPTPESSPPSDSPTLFITSAFEDFPPKD